MRVFHAIVQVLAGPVFDVRQKHTSGRAIAKMLLSALLGVRVLARVRPQRDVLEGAVNGVLGLLKASA
jgi:hypothetical protein